MLGQLDQNIEIRDVVVTRHRKHLTRLACARVHRNGKWYRMIIIFFDQITFVLGEHMCNQVQCLMLLKNLRCYIIFGGFGLDHWMMQVSSYGMHIYSNGTIDMVLIPNNVNVTEEDCLNDIFLLCMQHSDQYGWPDMTYPFLPPLQIHS